MLSSLPLKTSYREDIQGLRALAVLSVITFHVNKEWLPGGFIGVDIFLVISGFLITSIIIKQQEIKNFSFKHFFINRVKRIVPAYFVLLAVVTYCMAILLTPTDYKFFYDSLKSSIYFASNQYFSSFGDYFAPNANELPLMHTWSLAVEMQFYLFLPFLLVLTPSRYLGKIIPILIITLTVYSSYEVFIDSDRQKMYFSLLARAPEFLIGTWLALNSFRIRWNTTTSNLLAAIGLLLIAMSLILIDESTPFPGFIAIPACVGTSFIIAAQNSATNNLFSHPALVWIGVLSYSLYLWHWPILAGFRYYYGEYELDGSLIFLFIILTLIFSYSSYRFVESGPLSKLTGLHSLYGLFGIVFFVITTTLISKSINKNIVTAPAVNLTRYAPPNEICHGKIVGDCVRGNKNIEPQVMLIGDSHAAQLNLSFDAIADSSYLSIKVVTASTCVTIPGFDVERIPKWARQRCMDQISNVQEILPNYQKIIIAGMWSSHIRSKKFLDAFEQFLARAELGGIDIIILAQIPMIKSNPLRLQRFHALNLPTQATLNDSWRGSNQRIKQVAESYSNTTFLDYSNTSFFERTPFYEKELIYHDTHHLNEVGAINYGHFIRDEMIELLSNPAEK